MYKMKPVLIRVGLWLVSFLIADLCFSFFLGFFSLEVFAIYFVFTLFFAWPAWCLFLPVVVSCKNAEGRRIWALLCGGVLAGPLSLFLWDAVTRLRGKKALILGTDPLHSLGGFGIAFAMIVGSLTTCAYVYGLKRLHNRADRAVAN